MRLVQRPLECVFTAAAMLLSAGCGGDDDDVVVPPVAAEAAPTAATCPTEVAAVARCLSGKDSAGAYYFVAMPMTWNNTLVLHAHGGPELGGAPTSSAGMDEGEE